MAKQRYGAPRRNIGERLEPVQGPAKNEDDEVVSNMRRRERKFPQSIGEEDTEIFDSPMKTYKKGGLVKKACVRGMGAAVRGGGYNT